MPSSMMRAVAILFAYIVTKTAAFSSTSKLTNVFVPSLRTHQRTSAMNLFPPSPFLLSDILPDATATVLSTLNEVNDAVGIATDAAATSQGPTFSDTVITTYSKKSYFATLGLYALSFPGLWSTIKRSTKVKMVRKQFETTGDSFSAMEGAEGAEVPVKTVADSGPLTLQMAAANIMSYMQTNNYKVVGTPGSKIKFEGIVKKSKSQAFFLTFVTAICFASLALVLQIQFNGDTIRGESSDSFLANFNWFYLCFLSPYAGVYYWSSGDRVDEFEIKLTDEGEDGGESKIEVGVLGGEEEVDRMWRSLKLREKGMVEVKGFL